MTKYTPAVSVLVAARNEADNIANCLSALTKQHYPLSKIEILVGDDESDDETSSIVTAWSKKYPTIRLFTIRNRISHLKGKANVLAQLARVATGEVYFITDADVIVGANWIEAIVDEMQDGTAIVTGVTSVRGPGLFAQLQNADWIFNICLGYLSSKRGKSVTAMGNNMAVSKAAYERIGGYENIPFSITEDYELYRNVIKSGFKFKSLYNRDVLAFTEPIVTWGQLLHQRKRWFTGAFQLPFLLASGVLFQCLLLPIFLLLGVLFGWPITLKILLMVWILNIVQLHRFYAWIKLDKRIGIYVYFPYSLFSNFFSLLFKILPISVNWKGRKY